MYFSQEGLTTHTFELHLHIKIGYNKRLRVSLERGELPPDLLSVLADWDNLMRT